MNVIQKINKTIQKNLLQLGANEVEVRKISLVRQRRAIKVGELKYIDFALPCFKMAKLLNIKLNDLTQTITDQLEESFAGIAHFEAVAGYVNVELSSKEIKHLVDESLDSKALASSKIQPCYEAIFYILDTDEELRKLFANIIGALESALDIKKSKWESIYYDVNSDTILIDDFIEWFNAHHPNTLVYNPHSSAIYAAINGNNYSIRDIRGRYKSNAYLIQAFFSNKRTEKIQCIVARQEYIDLAHQLNEFTGDKSSLVNHFFNPFVVKTDTDEIIKKIKNMESISHSIYDLTNKYRGFIKDRKSRLEVLDLLFFNYDISNSFSDLNVPLLFDRINQALDSIYYLKSVDANRG